MASLLLSLLALFLVSFGSVTQAEKTLFPSGDSFEVVDLSAVSDSDEHEDPENTGSLLYSRVGVESKRVGKNIMVALYSSDNSDYFRAHPGFMKCAQGVILSLLRQDIRVDIVSGYRVKSEVDSDILAEKFLRTGCAIQLEPRDNDPTKLETIASTVLKVCPVILERYYRDLGLILMNDRVHFHMSGPVSSGPLIQLDGYTGGTVTGDNIMEWALSHINAGLDPASVPTCDNFTSLTEGEHYPAGISLDMAVGSFHEAVTRYKETDFKRLLQYQGTSIEFADEESDSDWCGESRVSCPPCRDWLKGNTLENRCSDRLMSARLLNLLNKLQRKVRDSPSLPQKVKVLDAWVEPNSAAPSPADDSLHLEGRAVTLEFSQGSTSSNLGTLAKYAVCMGADYVEHRGTFLIIAVKRMQGTSYAENNKRKFPSLELLAVDPPSSVSEEYELPDDFTASDKALYPLFDGAGRENLKLADNVTIGMFMSEGNRYFRLSPRLVSCYVAIVHRENKRKANSDPTINVTVVSGFLSNSENRRSFDALNDQRYGSQILGVGMQLRYENPPMGYTPLKLLYTAIDRCAQIFHLDQQEMGIGLYKDSIFVDLRDEFSFFNKTDGELPENITFDQFEEQMENRYLAARDNRVVGPDNTTFACLFTNPPKFQSCDFVHEHPEHVKRRRRRRETSPDDCIPTRQTEFCQSTVQERQDQVQEILSMLDRKHYRCHPREIIKETLRKCFGDCGTCLQGDIFEDKTEHCNNLLHWIDWTLENDKPNVTNFFVRRNEVTRRHACEHGEECIERSPLFSLIAPTVEKVYRPDPSKSVEELLYSSTDNPSPVYQLLEDMYAMQASGIVKFWVNDDKEMAALKRQLEVVMLYNKHVTMIKIYVVRYKNSKEAVGAVVEAAAAEMASKGCPAVSRQILTYYEILEVPQDREKRAAEPQDLSYHIRKYYRDFESRWLDQIRL